MDASSPINPPNSHGTMDDSSEDSDSSFISSDDIHDSFSSTSSDGPLYEMDSLRAHLPFKRGLSKFFAGKSQSFTSLSDVKCLNDLVKPENPYKKKIKSCHSYGGLLNCQSYPPQHSSRCNANPNPHKPNSHKPNSTNPNKPTFIPDRPPVIPLTNT